MRIRPNKAIINDYLIENYAPKTVVWKSDYDLTIEFNEDKIIFITFDDCDLNASVVNVIFEPNGECENSDEIIDGLNKLRKKSGIDYIDFETTFRNFFDANESNIQRHYEYLKSVMEDNKIDRFLDKYGRDIQKFLPDFSINRDAWKYESKGDYYYYVNLYKLEFRPNKVRVIDNDNDLIINLDWNDSDE
ncbi:hypothetical protein [Lactobacillus mulieris]|uniref:hypothetical protein n=1 Tax=Lactobacillus mulieris TaxID=2508708 RepID=UPI0022440835|nr:hypothetical protein [Lactobacillus mulieris]MCW8123425.1 hypothetical protein [Lactobacillus mulieris]MDK7326588.1 hypothetical protein [Lactobacillus mulieris]